MIMMTVWFPQGKIQTVIKNKGTAMNQATGAGGGKQRPPTEQKTSTPKKRK